MKDLMSANEEMLEWAKDLFGDEFSEEELLNRLEDYIKQDICYEEME